MAHLLGRWWVLEVERSLRVLGLTRPCITVGPKNLITALSQSGSFLDGGANHPLQVAAIPLLDPARCLQERVALQRYFKAKRDHVLDRLARMGLPVTIKPAATFYIWLVCTIRICLKDTPI